VVGFGFRLTVLNLQALLPQKVNYCVVCLLSVCRTRIYLSDIMELKFRHPNLTTNLSLTIHPDLSPDTVVTSVLEL
jgi:hypothetical protein